MRTEPPLGPHSRPQLLPIDSVTQPIDFGFHLQYASISAVVTAVRLPFSTVTSDKLPAFSRDYQSTFVLSRKFFYKHLAFATAVLHRDYRTSPSLFVRNHQYDTPSFCPSLLLMLRIRLQWFYTFWTRISVIRSGKVSYFTLDI